MTDQLAQAPVDVARLLRIARAHLELAKTELHTFDAVAALHAVNAVTDALTMIDRIDS